MTDKQLATLLRRYHTTLESVMEHMQAELPISIQKVEKTLGGTEYKSFPVLKPLHIVISDLQEDIDILIEN